MPDAHPYRLSEVLTDELQQFGPIGDLADMPPARDGHGVPLAINEPERRRRVYRAMYRRNLAALCLSGGGIRSASFCLGIIQALAETGLLSRFHYLSTVSGGGYIGAWLSAWLARAADRTEVLRLLYTRRAPLPPPRNGAYPDPAAEPAPIEHLREYSNYLTAKAGLLSADTWAALAIVLRNIVLNWLILLPAIALVVVAFKLVATFAHGGAVAGAMPTWLLVFLALVLTALSLGYKLRRLYWPDDEPDAARAQRRFLLEGVLPAIVAGYLLACAVTRRGDPGGVFAVAVGGGSAALSPWSWLMALGFTLLALAVGAAFAWLSAPPAAAPEAQDDAWRREARRWIKWRTLSWLAAAAVFGIALWLGAALANSLDPVVVLGKGWCVIQSVPCEINAKPVMAVLPIRLDREVLLAVAGVPWFLLSAASAHAAYLFCCSYSPWGDVEREWLGRASGWYLIAALGWAALGGVVLFGPKLYFSAAVLGHNAGAWMSAITAASGTVTAWLGRIALTPAQGGAKGWPAISANIGLALAAAVFAVLLLILLSAWADGALLGAADAACFSRGGDIPPTCYSAWRWTALAALLATVAAVAGWFVNVNRFSLHAVYRNRLIRAYLGGSRAGGRRPDPFTGFDWDDNLRVRDLWPGPAAEGAPWRPFHVINMTLNLAATRNLAWQQRKAMAFAATPRFAGAAGLGYRRTAEYGDPRNGISLGTAMAISGAAVSPNMGYHSSPAVAFLLTLFDVRLGWWLGNPGAAGARTYPFDGPRLALRPLLSELFGLTNEDSPYVYLSDGGHFDNLGIYEMVRRRCRWILVIDAGADPKRGFADLGNAVRKAWIDLGVRISFSQSPLLPAGADAKPADVPYFALGTVEYPDDGDPAPPTGQILYLKPTVRGDEDAADILAYWRSDPAFPDQTTADQWFDEPQLEAYRALGHLIVRAITTATRPARRAAPADLEQLFERLARLDPKTLRPRPAQ